MEEYAYKSFFMNSLAEVKNAKMQKMHSTIFPHTGARI